ncbi:hypothetical protein B4Q13_22165 [Lacticaseibacillus rhamnosus]
MHLLGSIDSREAEALDYVLAHLDELVVLVVLLVEDLQCDVAFEQRVMSLVDGRHAAVPDDFLQFVSPSNRLPD